MPRTPRIDGLAMHSPAAQLYVYYRVRAVDAPALIAAVRRMQADWQAALPGLVCGLSQRADEHSAATELTLMETYAVAPGVPPLPALPPNWPQELEARARTQLAPWLLGERHVEVFVPCA